MRLPYTLVTFWMLAGFVRAEQHPSTATSPSEVQVVYTLGNDNNATIAKNPSAEQIKAALAALDGDKALAVYLNRDETHGIQANWDSDSKLSFQYQDGGDQHTYQTTKKYPRDMAMKLFLSYMSGKDDWLKMVTWEHVK